MTDALIDPARDGDVARVMRDIESLSESDRRRLAPQALKLLRAVRDAYVGRVLDKPWPFGEDPESVLRATQVLVLGTATGAELRKVGPWGVPTSDLAFETLAHRPTVAADLVDAIADNPPVRWNSGFRLMRSLVRAGHVERPENPGYILAMINGLEIRDVSVYDALVADPGLLENEVWRVFEVEGAGETSLAAHDKYSREAQNWSTALGKLSVEGKLPRARLLDASLAALRRDFAPFRAGWFSRFHEQLAPTPDERREREDDYAALLSSPVPATVSFAVNALAQAGAISERNIDRLSPTLASKSASTVKAAIRLLRSSDAGAVIAAAALPQATRDGQAALLAFIKKAAGGDSRVAELISEAAPALAPALRDQALRLAGQTAESKPRSPDSEGVQPARVALSSEVAQPVRSLNELVELLATLLEHIEAAHEMERALDGVSRLCDRADPTIRRLEPVAKRVRELLSDRSIQPFAGVSPRADIAGLIIAWISGTAPPVPPLRVRRLSFLGPKPSGPRKSVLGFLSYRAHEIAARAARGKPAPILSMPTSPGGAIDPAVLASRRQELGRLHITPGEGDAIQAALRAGEIQPKAGVRFGFGSTRSSHVAQGKTYKHVHFHLQVDPPVKGEPTLADVPALFMTAFAADESERREADYCAGDYGSKDLAEAVRWVATVWPSNRELFYAKGAMELGRNVDWWEARWYVRSFLEPLLLPTEPIRDMGTLLVALGLGAKESGEHTLATDVFIAGAGQGRLDAPLLGETLGKLYDNGVLKGTRVASALGDASQVSHGHVDAVVQTIEGLLAVMHGPPPPDLHAVLSVLSDALTTLNRPLRDLNASAYLSGVEGTGKAAANARALLAQGRHASRD